METSYIGITGFKDTQTVHAVASSAEQLGYPNAHTVMFGYLTSDKRLSEPTVAGKRSPAVSTLPALVAAAPDWSVPMLHYHTKDHARMRADVDYLLAETGASAVQLNMAWPALEDIAALTAKHSGLRVLLQLPARATEGLTPEQIAARATPYDGFVAYALIDASGGTGIPFAPEPTAQLLRALEDAMLQTRIGVAGGFTPENVAERVRFLNRHATRPYCIDAESGVMTNNALDVERMTTYLARFAEVTQ